ncbi:DnaD domain-containing protein [Clostridium amazonitimonense]|uniref:DnaD domain-containing protein n=1 Tax=Clostridium amazonitimonense TaxID=1499689 RepID=UPI00068F7D64|nr:DnaD domain protein [Clostridium amazonitimonense]
MAKYRSFQLNFWQDNFIVSLPFEERNFYHYLITNPRTNQCGIYVFSLPFASLEFGLSKEKIKELLQRFVDHGKILYDEATEEIMVLNWYKYNVNSSRNTHICINKELKMVKTKSFVSKFYELCKSMKFCLDIMFEDIEIIKEPLIEKPLEYEESQGFQESQEPQELQELQELQEPEESLEKPSDNEGDTKDHKKGIKEVINAFDNNIHLATFMEIESLKSWYEEMGGELVVLAISEAVKNNVRNIKYINGILLNWKNNGLKTLSDVSNYMKNFKASKYSDFKPQNAAAYEVVTEEV